MLVDGAPGRDVCPDGEDTELRVESVDDNNVCVADVVGVNEVG
jgi:hypothetical protein